MPKNQSFVIDNTTRFGIEIEMYAETKYEQLRQTLMDNGLYFLRENRPDINCECPTCQAGYADASKSWIVKGDGSINPAKVGYYGIEIVSPILSGMDGLNQIKKIGKILKQIKAEANDTCGFHVHVDAKDMPTKTVLHLMSRYFKHEKKIDRLILPSRHKSNNGYCSSMQGALKSLKNYPNNKPQEVIASRYYKLNVAALAKHGTIEFRHHEGTVDIDEILNWTKFCINFVEKGKQNVDINTNVFVGLDKETKMFFQRKRKKIRLFKYDRYKRRSYR